MLSKIKIFLRSPFQTKLFLLEILFFLSLSKACIKLFSFKTIFKYIGKKTDSIGVAPSQNIDRSTLQGLHHYITKISKHLPWGAVCLDQAIAAKWMLDRRNISSVLYFGVMKDGDVKNFLKAHAWLMVGDYCVTGDGYEQYKLIAVYQ